ncbi:hypothetical protein J2Z66_000880 [Paenibacillus eucommiae]|uniref:Uncharacterized protein n=1 Tax=Paenibacillus eucommiae TaxID=1355755 RepID=A0ABS4IP47_9BACL|nr:hypothetical protein [Paenibacillus eucommiae]
MTAVLAIGFFIVVSMLGLLTWVLGKSYSRRDH